jgi:outer membrane protein, heavy metal efflux system
MARKAVAVGAAIFAVAATAHAEERAVDRASLIAEALHAHPAIRSAEQRASAARRSGEAEGSLPPPEAMMQIWQVPIAKPYALSDAQMIMFGVGQSFPAAGARAARERAAGHEADAERAMVAMAALQIRREVDHAFADYAEATARHQVHAEHRILAIRTLDLARARHAGAGSLSDVAQADVELARVDADLATDATRVDAAARRINVLLGRDALAPLGPPAIAPAETTAWDAPLALAKARASRPELRVTAARRDAERERTHALEREATLPSFSVAALYFAPTSPMPHHGYGLNASVTLPWLWGQASARRDASRESAAASASNVDASRRPIDGDVVSQEASVRAATLRLQTLRDRALPASKQSFDVAWAGYAAARTDLLTLLSTRRTALDIEMEIVSARAALDHALAELDAAVGVPVPRRPIEGGAP